MFQQYRWNLFEFAWRLNFAGRMIEKTRCSIRTGWRFSKETQEKMPHWFDAKPSEVADFQIKTGLQYMQIFTQKEEIDQWFTSAEPGEIACYGMAKEQRRPLRFMMEHANGYYERDEAQLFQKKQPDGSFHYLIRKAKGKKNAVKSNSQR